MTVSARSAVRWLNFRTLSAQVGVSRLGKMFSNTRLPSRSTLVISLRSLRVSVKEGVGCPGRGSSSQVWMGFPFRVIVAMGTSRRAHPTPRPWFRGIILDLMDLFLTGCHRSSRRQGGSLRLAGPMKAGRY